jgi:predicted DNA-binding protein
VLNDRVKLQPKKERDCMFSIRIDKRTLDGYDQLSSITGHSRNELINQAMEHYLKIVEIDSSDENMAKQIKQFINTYQEKKG